MTKPSNPVGVRESLDQIRVDAELAKHGGDPAAKLRADNIRMYLALEAVKLGTPEQQRLYREGRLPDEEILALARHELFFALQAFERWSLSHEKPKMVRQVRHVVGCDPERRDYKHEVEAARPPGAIGWPPGPRAADDLTDVEASNLRTLRAIVELIAGHQWLVNTGGTVTVSVFTHWVSCTTCDGDTARTSAKVSIQWGERELVREYAL